MDNTVIPPVQMFPFTGWQQAVTPLVTQIGQVAVMPDKNVYWLEATRNKPLLIVGCTFDEFRRATQGKMRFWLMMAMLGGGLTAWMVWKMVGELRGLVGGWGRSGGKAKEGDGGVVRRVGGKRSGVVYGLGLGGEEEEIALMAAGEKGQGEGKAVGGRASRRSVWE